MAIKISDNKLILLLMLLQLAVCVPFINSFPIALDEPFSIFWAQQDLGEMIVEINKGNNSPLHFVLLHFWIKLFGIGAISVRSLSLIFSLFTILFLFKTAKFFVQKELATMVVLIYIFSRFNHFHALEARMYALIILETTILIFVFFKAFFNDKLNIILFITTGVAMCYTHYLAIIFLFFLGIAWLIYLKKFTGKNNLYFIIGFISIGLLFLPGALSFYNRLNDGAMNSTWVPKPHWTELYGNVIRFLNNPFAFISFVSIVLIYLILKKVKKEEIKIKSIFPKIDLTVYFLFIGPYLFMFLYSLFFAPIFLDRYLLFTTIPLYLSIVVLISRVRISGKFFLPELFFIVTLIASFQIIPNNNREPNQMAFDAKSIKAERTCIAICPPYFNLNFIYYYDENLFQSKDLSQEILHGFDIFPIYSFNDLNGNLKNYDALILIDDNMDFAYPQNSIKNDLLLWGNLKQTKDYSGGSKLYHYKKK